MTFPFSRVCLFACMAFLSATVAQGALIITVGNVTLLPGETKPVDVLIRSDGSDTLQLYAIRLQLDTTGIGSLLQFAAPPSDAELLDPNYVFSTVPLANLAFNSLVTSTSTTNDAFDSAAFTIDSSNVSLTGSDQLLARVDVTAFAGAPRGAFVLSFVDASASFEFTDDSGIGVPLSFTSTNGAVTVLGSAAVPEPFSFLLWAGGFAIMATANRFRRRA